MRLSVHERNAKKSKKAARSERVTQQREHDAQRERMKLEALYQPPDPSSAMAGLPLYECRIGESFWDEGIGHVWVLRERKDGRLFGACFLIDAYCLGVKDAFLKTMTREEFRELVLPRQATRVVAAPYAAKLVLDALAYARQYGLPPHPDYLSARDILAGIDPTACTETFEFGVDGKPHFIAGPHDDRSRVARVMQALTDSVGEDGFIFTVPQHVLPDHLEGRALREVVVD